jgi:hypothetical protein
MAREPGIGADVKGVLALAAVLTLVGVGVGDPSLGVILTLLVYILLVFAMARVPLRNSMATLMFFAMVLPNPAEGTPTKWDPPFTVVGTILLDHLNTVNRSLTYLSSLSFSGMDLMLVALALIAFSRKMSGSRIDSAGLIQVPKQLRQLAMVALASAGFAWVSGLVRGGDFSSSLWQLFAVIYLPLLFLLIQASIRGPKDYPMLAKSLLAAATYKCFLALFVISTIVVPMDPETGSTRPAYATAHADSMLFSAAFVLVLAPVFEGVGRRAKWYAAAFLPILLLGTWANGRRLAWVQVGLVAIIVFFVAKEGPFKKRLRRIAYAAAPLFGLYVAAGWNSSYGTFFKLARMIRSVVDAKSDGSSLWREYENVNIIATFRAHPIFGAGFGNPYEEIVVLPTVDYPLEKFIPHNSLLGVWCYTGVVGYAGLTMLWMGGVYYAMRAYYKTPEASQRAAGMVCFACVLIYMMQCWGDLGLSTWTGVFLMSASIACAGKLAVAAGSVNG